MGRKRLTCPPLEELYATVSKMLIPEFILQDFDIYGATESTKKWVIELREKEGRIPEALRSVSDVVFDGYCNPIETLSHSFVCKPVYLQLYRRRYKQSNKDEHFSNEYDFTLKGLKIVPELGVFLKEEDRRFPR
ncbi:MAG: hypothetical protein LBQ39_01590 [Tannerellaceae bacterium]|jgi:hypothetical protein|nr:hypothetical protein [Tannerellaceae bacterium]